MTQDRYFRHFKGGLYKLLYEARDSETREEVEEFVIVDKKVELN